MNGLDLRTFLIVVEILISVYMITTFFVYYVQRHIMHLFMGFALIASLSSFILIRTTLDHPTMIIVFGYNILFLLSTMLIIGGFRSFFKLGSFSYRYGGYLCVSVIGTWFFSAIIPLYLGRVGISSFFVVLFIVDTLVETRLSIRQEATPIKRLIYALMGSLITLFVLRFIITLLMDPISSLTQSIAIATFTTGFFTIIIYNVWITGSLLLESNLVVKNLNTKSLSMESLAMKDPLTQLNNRHRLDLDMHNYIEQGNRQGGNVSLLLMDLDHFKEINDQFGHDVGDQVLVAATSVITSVLRADDRIYRWGGDELMIITPYTNLEGAARLAQRINEKVASTEFPVVKSITVSIGCAQHFYRESQEDWFKRADITLYRAKQAGRNRHDVWLNSESLSVTITKLIWNESLTSGIEALDMQHKALMNLNNELYERLIKSESVANLDEILDKVLFDLHDHYVFESDLMRSLEFPLLAEHMKIHAQLLKEYDQLRLHLKTGEVNLGAFYNFFSNKVVAEHILQEDIKFFAFNKSQLQ